MNFATITIITVITTLFFYLIFLVLGVGGIAKNRKAQGFDQNQRSNK
tara:strand:+ start:418 stop:558 length:141 start_codon:yes stop_codon:yes gene_type:complete